MRMTQRIRCKPPALLALAVGALLSAAAVNATSELRIVDGDTIDWGWRLRVEKARYRLAGIDAPEIGRAECDVEREQGKRATARLRGLVEAINTAACLGRLTLSGEDAAAIAIREGWGRFYDGESKRKSWCH